MKFKKGIDLQGSRATGAADASAATDLVTLQQLQAYVRGLNWKAAVRVKSTGNITLSAPGATINGVTMVVGDRMLLNNQTTGTENGIYVWNGAAVTATRAPDADTSAEMVGAAVYVTEGTVNPDTMWTQTIDPFTLGTTTPVFTQFGGGGTVYTASTGLTMVGSDIRVIPGNGILADGSSTRVDPSVVVRKYAANAVVTTNPQTFTHSLGTDDIQVQVWDVAANELVWPDITKGSGTVIIDWGSAPTAAQYRVIVQA
jgi:hypothetical protein